MKQVFRLLASTLATAALLANAHAQSGADGPALAPDALFARVSSNVWVMQASDAQGRVLATGSAVAVSQGMAVTSCRLLSKASSVTLKRDNVSFGAVLEFPDVERDLCQLRIANFAAASLGIAPARTLQVGMPLFAIGAPRGKELTLGANMLAGIRRNNAGDLEALQLATAPEAGLGGAGLFDAQGRLAGFVGAAPSGAASASATLAMPASWIQDLPARGRAAIERLEALPATVSGSGDVGSATGRPTVIEYRLQDRLTSTQRKVIYRSDGATGDQISFNNGGWVEKPGGEVTSVTTSVAGEFDVAMPPGGWARPNLKEEAAWRTKYTSTIGGTRINMDLHAAVMEDATLTVDGHDINVVRIKYQGYTQRLTNVGTASGNQYGPYEADVWFSPELGRVVRFQAATRGGAMSSSFQVNETLELVSIR